MNDQMFESPPAIVAPASPVVAEPDASSLRELFAAERMLFNANQGASTFRQPKKIGSGDVALARLREKRRQRAKQVARRLKASRS